MNSINSIYNQLQPFIPAMILSLLLGLALLWAWSPLRSLLSQRHLHKLVRRIGLQSVNNVYLTDDHGDVIYIENLILQPERLLLVTIKHFRGNIFAAERIDQWTQVIGHRSYKFPNPLHQQEADVQVLQSMLPKQTIDKLVVFARGSRFPKGKPQQVCDFNELKTLAQAEQGQPAKPLLQQAWDDLSARMQHAANVKQGMMLQSDDRKRLTRAIVAGLTAIGYAVWYWLL